MIQTIELMVVKEVIPIEIQPGTILSINTKEVTSHTHGFHKYPAKFIPHIPKWAIGKYLNGSGNRTILDPFCGSGTTLVEGLLAGHNVIGLDVDPLSSLITKVKTTPIDSKILNEVINWLTRSIKQTKKGEFEPECKTIEHWFSRNAINKLSIIRTLINQVLKEFGSSKEFKDIQYLLLICFSSIIRRVSNADNESQKTYVSHTKIKEPEEVYSVFFPQLELFVERLKTYFHLVNTKLATKIICTSSTESIDIKLKGENIDLAVTSPPYIKAIDYIYNQMVELFWIGDLLGLESQAKQNKKKKGYIGTKYIHKVEFKDYTPYNTMLGIDKLDKKLQQIYDSDKKNGHKHSFVNYKYFADMEKHFSEMAKCLSEGTPYVMVVGDSSVSDIYFATSDFLVEIAERNGFKIRNKWGYKIKNRYMRFDRKGRGGLIEIDWVLEFIRN